MQRLLDQAMQLAHFNEYDKAIMLLIQVIKQQQEQIKTLQDKIPKEDNKNKEIHWEKVL